MLRFVNILSYKAFRYWPGVRLVGVWEELVDRANWASLTFRLVSRDLGRGWMGGYTSD